LRAVVCPETGTAPTSWQSRAARWAQQSEGRKGRGLVLLAVVVYIPALLFGGFVWDDWIFVTEPLVRRLDGIVSIWLSPAAHRQGRLPLAPPGRLLAGRRRCQGADGPGAAHRRWQATV